MKLLSIGLRRMKTASKPLLIAIPLIKLLAIPLGCQKTATKWLVISPKVRGKRLVMVGHPGEEKA